MRPQTRWLLVAFGASLVVLGLWLMLFGRNKREPGADPVIARIVGGLVMIAFGAIIGAVGINLAMQGK